MRIVPTALPDVLIVESPVHHDDRGFLSEVFHAEKFAGLGLPTAFTQVNHSRSARNTLRGLHYQLVQAQGKLVRPMSGAIFDVAVDVRRGSATSGEWVGLTLSAGDGRQLWIPPGFAHGFLVTSDVADVAYLCTTTYNPSVERSIIWSDVRLGIDWPLPRNEAPLLSPKDAAAPAFQFAELVE